MIEIEGVGGNEGVSGVRVGKIDRCGMMGM